MRVAEFVQSGVGHEFFLDVIKLRHSKKSFIQEGCLLKLDFLSFLVILCLCFPKPIFTLENQKV